MEAPAASSLCQSSPLYGREKKTDLLFLVPLHVIFQLYLGPGLYHTWEVPLAPAEEGGIGEARCSYEVLTDQIVPDLSVR